MSAISLVVADRSASVRSVIRRMVEGRGIRVVGEACNGREVVEVMRATGAEGLVADLDLGELSGRELVDAVAGERPVPVFVLTPAVHAPATRVALAAQERGVVAIFEKPGLPEGWSELGEALRTAILEVRAAASSDPPVGDEPDDTPVIGPNLRYAAVGASAGGPGALVQLLRHLGGERSPGIAVVQHIAAGFETVLAEWLAGETGLDVAVAKDGEVLDSGRVRLAPAGVLMILRPDGALRVDPIRPGDGDNGQSVARLFESLLAHPPASVAAVLLSGMGRDGAEAMARLKAAGVLTVAQDRQSCAVYGMPRVAVEAGAVTISMSPAEIGSLLAKSARGRR